MSPKKTLRATKFFLTSCQKNLGIQQNTASIIEYVSMFTNETTSHPWASTLQWLNKNCSIPEIQVAAGNDSKSIALFHFAHACFLVAYMAPNSRYGQVALHSGMCIGFLVLSTWAWNVICAPDVFAWYFAFSLLNVGQLLYIVYKMRPIR